LYTRKYTAEMRLPYLSRKNSGWVVQVRIPVTLDPLLQLTPIRTTIGVMPAIEARRKAICVVAAVHSAIAEVERMSERQSISPPVARDLTTDKINRVLPTLLGLDALAVPTATSDQAVIKASFDALAEIGNGRATGEGIFANPSVRHEMAYIAALTTPSVSAAMAGEGAPQHLEALANHSSVIAQQSSELADQVERIGELTSALRTMHSVGIVPATEGPLFSQVLKAQIAEKSGLKGDDAELVGIYRKVGAEFIAILGDHPVGSYRRTHLQQYANEMAWFPPRAAFAKNYRHQDVVDHIERNKKRNGQGLAAKTIKDGRVAHIKAIIARGCEDAGVVNHVAGTRIDVPDRATPSKKRKAPASDALDMVLQHAVDHEGLTNALMLVLGTLTGRRVSLLATLRREDVVLFNGTYVIEIASHRYEGDQWVRVPFKSNDSLEFIIVPDALASTGFVEWAKKSDGPMFPEFMACKDPGDAAQKKVNRVIAKVIGEEGLAHFTFHGLRAGRIDDALDNDLAENLVKHQVGHKATTDHQRYQSLTPKKARKIASQPLPDGVDWSCLDRIDYTAPQIPTHRSRKAGALRAKVKKGRRGAKRTD
jgi:integrase